MAAATLPGQVPVNPSPARLLGHPRLRISTAAENLIEGRELSAPQSVAVDANANIVYVADTRNHRVLAWRNATSYQNGAPADFVIGQRDKFATDSNNVGAGFNSGLTAPTGIALDSQGNLWVVDAGNNRIVRYSRPGAQPDSESRLADFVVGQQNLSSRSPNFGGSPSARNLSLSTTQGVVFRSSLLFDGQGNLWVTDSANHRVLRYPAAALTGDSFGPPADLVIGQSGFTTNATPPNNITSRLVDNAMRAPSSIALDQGGRLFVCDGFSRVLVFAGPFSNGMRAARIMGVVVLQQGQPAPLPVNPVSLGFVTGTTSNPTYFPPEGVFTIGNIPFVVDTPNSRILRYDAFDQWPPVDVSFSPPARATIGQDAADQEQPVGNRGRAEPNATSFLQPVSGVFAGGRTYIADAGNNRVLVFPDLSTGPPLASGDPYRATAVFGQIDFFFRSANLIEGREFGFAASGSAAAGIAIDTRSNPPRLYVADTTNHRILGFRDARNVRPGDRADIVIGQTDCFRALVNSPSNNANNRSAGGLFLPIAVAVDREGNLWVADNGNARVLRFPAPFSSGAPGCDGAGGRHHEANLVVGQSSFTARITDASSRTMATPYGIAFSNEGNLLVSDSTHNRVLLFRPPFTNGMAAERAFGQPDFESIAAGNADNRMNVPRHIAMDTDDRLYVTDSGNNRVLIFTRAPLAGPDPRAVLILTRSAGTTLLRNPVGIAVSPITGEIWVSHAPTNSPFIVYRFPRFDTLVSSGDVRNYDFQVNAALALALDDANNLVIADGANRVAFHFPFVGQIVNGANYAPRATAVTVTSAAAPGMIATMKPACLQGSGATCTVTAFSFTDRTQVFNELPNPLPLPTVLGDLSVLIDDVPVGLFFVSPFQINFLFPNNLPTGGNVELQLIQASTGRVIASQPIAMNIARPGIFTLNSSGSGQSAALNQDNSVNGSGNRAQRGQVVQLFATGQGFIPNAPPDGTAATGAISTPDRPRVVIGGHECEVQYSGLAPGLVGVWQINVVLNSSIPPGEQLVVVSMNDVASGNQTVGIVPTVWVQ